MTPFCRDASPCPIAVKSDGLPTDADLVNPAGLDDDLTPTLPTQTPPTLAPAPHATATVTPAMPPAVPLPRPTPALSVPTVPTLPTLPTRSAAPAPDAATTPSRMFAPPGPHTTMVAAPGGPLGGPILPSLPTSVPAPAAEAPPARVGVFDLPVAEPEPEETTETGTALTAHPMAHLMNAGPEKGEASKRAAALRTARKRRAKRIKIIVAILAIAAAAIAGPPLVSWLSSAVNDTGSTEQPGD